MAWLVCPLSMEDKDILSSCQLLILRTITKLMVSPSVGPAAIQSGLVVDMYHDQRLVCFRTSGCDRMACKCIRCLLYRGV